jgi:hypothetical protein
MVVRLADRKAAWWAVEMVAQLAEYLVAHWAAKSVDVTAVPKAAPRAALMVASLAAQ